jgi:alpha-tubulin suppressor-like RCC1 family protein
MTLQASGTISMSNIDVEIGVAATTLITLNDTTVRTLANVPSGTIALNNFYGTSFVPSGGLWTCGGVSPMLGLNNTAYSSPVQVGTLTTWKQVSPGSSHTMAIKTDGTLWGWGGNSFGGLGLNNTTTFSSPVQVGTLTNWKQVASGSNSSAAIKTDGSLWAWGLNNTGAVGQNTTTTAYSSPMQVGTLTTWKQVTCGLGSFHAIKTDGTLWSCGYNNNGQLGQNSRTSVSSPVQVGSLTTWNIVNSNIIYSWLAIKTDGTLWGCGNNPNGNLGQNSTNPYSSPVQIGSLTTWKSISGGATTLAIKTDGTLWGCGANNTYQLGLGSNTTVYSLVQVGTGSTWNMASNYNNTTAIKSDGSLWVCGYNYQGGLGLNSSQTYYSVLTQVGTLTSWKSVNAGAYYFMNIR